MSNKPTHRIYAVTKNGRDKAFWTEIGAAWPHKDGKGMSLKLSAVPLGDAEIVLRADAPKDATTTDGGAQ